MSSTFSRLSDVVDSARYAIGSGVVATEEAAKSARRAVGEMAGSASGQLALFSVLLGMLPVPVATAVAVGAAASFGGSNATSAIFVLNGTQSDDGDDDRPIPDRVGVSFSRLPAGTNFKASILEFGSTCIEGARNGANILFGQRMTDGKSVFSKEINGIEADVRTNFASGGNVQLNMTCVGEFMTDMANKFPLPSPLPPEAIRSIKASGIMLKVMFAIALALAVAHVVLDCRRYRLAERDADRRGIKAPLLRGDRRGSDGSSSGSGSEGGTFAPVAAAAAPAPSTPLVMPAARTPSSTHPAAAAPMARAAGIGAATPVATPLAAGSPRSATPEDLL